MVRETIQDFYGIMRRCITSEFASSLEPKRKTERGRWPRFLLKETTEAISDPRLVKGMIGHEIFSQRHPHKTVLTLMTAIYFGVMQALIDEAKPVRLSTEELCTLARPREVERRTRDETLKRISWAWERNKVIRALVRGMPEGATRSLPSVDSLVTWMKEGNDDVGEKKRMVKGREDEQQWIWKQQIKALTRILESRKGNLNIKIKMFPEVGEFKLQDVPQIISQVIDEYLEGLDCMESLMDILCDSDLEEGI